MSSGADQIRAERGRQITSENYPLEHDRISGGAEPLAQAARSYVMAALGAGDMALAGWPWPASQFKPTGVKRDLVKAGALIAAAIDQIDLAAQAATPLDTRGFHFGSIPEPEAPLTEGA